MAPMVKSNAVTEADALRTVVRKLLASAEFSGRGGQARLAKRIGVSAPYLSDFLNGKRGAGREMMLGLQRVAPDDVAAVVGVRLANIGAAYVPEVASAVALSAEGWMPRVAADVMEQLCELGYPPARVIPLVSGMRFEHDRPPTHMEIFRAAKHALDAPAAGLEELAPESSRDPSRPLHKGRGKKARPT